MCGINGIIDFQHNNPRAIQQMNHALAHRGPDDEGTFFHNGIALGQRRLSIIDLSSAGHQPMFSHDQRHVLIFNGEIYNYRELRKQLSYPFASDSDSEVILAAYRQWGSECVHHFNGMFAFAIYDTHTGQLFIARDRLGIKPLYYYYNQNTLVFSSEVRALLASGVFQGRLSYPALIDYLRYQTVHAPNTILENVYMLEPGTCLTVNTQNNQIDLSKHTWWQLGAKTTDVSRLNYNEIKEKVRTTFTEAVKKRLVADVPFGAFLSGGIDSSAVVGTMSQVAGMQVKTFNISFAEKEFSEAPYARMVAQKFQTDHHEIQLSPDDFLRYIPSALSSMDHPSGDGPNTWVVSKATKEAGITMALSGLGGDEVFAGYAIFKRMHALHQKQGLWKTPTGLRKTAGSLLQRAKPGIASDKIAALLAQQKYNFSTAYSVSRQVLLDPQINQMVKGGLTENISEVLVNSHPVQPSAHLLSQVSIAEINTYMQNVLLRDADQMSMAHALEVRVPFLDHELIELALGISDQYKYPVTPKKLLIDSLGDLLPPEIVNRPKMGFVFPWEHWLKDELFDLADARMQNLAQRPYFRKESILNLWNDFNQGNPKVTYSRIWPLVVLEHWLSANKID